MTSAAGSSPQASVRFRRVNFLVLGAVFVISLGSVALVVVAGPWSRFAALVPGPVALGLAGWLVYAGTVERRWQRACD